MNDTTENHVRITLRNLCDIKDRINELEEDKRNCEQQLIQHVLDAGIYACLKVDHAKLRRWLSHK